MVELLPILIFVHIIIIIALLRTQLNGTAIVGLDLILYEGAEEEGKNLAPKRKKLLFHHEILFNLSIGSSSLRLVLIH